MPKYAIDLMVQRVTVRANVIEKDVCVLHISPVVTGASFMVIAIKPFPTLALPQWSENFFFFHANRPA